MTSMFQRNLRDHLELFGRLEALTAAVTHCSTLFSDCMRRGNKLMICGNGGSAADSQHIAAELVGRFARNRRPLAALALTTDTSALTSIANDFSYGEVFARQVAGLGRRGDCLLAISTSGNSANVIRAVEVARELGIVSIGLLGCEGGRLASLCEHSIVVPSAVTARIQEAHILIGHTICEEVEDALAPEPRHGTTP